MLNKNRHDLCEAIGKWRSHYYKLYPNTSRHAATTHPEDAKLKLPSSYDAPQGQQSSTKTLAEIEYEIRLGYAYDAINDLRTTIHIYNASVREKKSQVFGQHPATRASAILTSLKDDIRDCAKQYRLSYKALQALGLPKNSELKPIGDDDLWGKDMTSMAKPGDSKRREPWYWVIGKPRDLSDAAWELECEHSSLYQLFQTLTICLKKWNVFAGSEHEQLASAEKKNSRFWMKNFVEHSCHSHEQVRYG